MRSRGRILLVLLSLFVIGGLLALAQGGATCADGKKTDEELLRIATHDMVLELREAAATALVNRLTDQVFKEGEYISADYLEEMAQSPTPELREKIPGLLMSAYLETLARGELTIDELISGIYTGKTLELRYARAGAALLALFVTETLGMSTDQFLQRFLESPEELKGLSLEPDVALDLLRKLENLLRGKEELWGYRFDGSLKAVRRGAAVLEIVILRITGKEAPLQLHSCEEWLALAGRGETEEFRSIANFVYFSTTHCAPHEPEALRKLAVNGASHELRLFAAFSYLEEVGERLGLDALMSLTVHGESEELREVAGSYLIGAFLNALFDGAMNAEKLYRLALEGETPQLRRAAGEALGMSWAIAIESAARYPGGPFGELAPSDIPRRSRAEAHSLEQALIIFAAENTIARPELARAAVNPLIVIWSGQAGG